MSVSTTQVNLQGVQLQWKGVPVFRGLNLQVEQGESFGVIGPSGSGKSVLLKLMSGLVRPTSGKALFQNEELHTLSHTKRRERARLLSMTFQRSGLFDSLSAKDNLRFPLVEMRVRQPEIEEKVESVLHDVGLSGQGELFPHEMSGGMQKRLGIARALILGPEVILYDDPTAGLDPVTSRTIVELMLEMKAKYRMTLVVVSSDLKVAYSLSDRMGFLYQGDFLQIGSVDEIRESSNPIVRQFVKGLLEGPLTEDD